eukprot:CAMPEP_0194279794 /NCGR_PEP_ID=MMETSP0169-20130528/14124_1 /TAXON_ID=218684 /ORGANISM="Corethron pennatum, Strain L29A3" /LENGTH=343 /DNA_ID=CAMNT_0039024261 /DNA_START=161 /DNA_END=1192 /DNA_ORIENTATION=+
MRLLTLLLLASIPFVQAKTPDCSDDPDFVYEDSNGNTGNCDKVALEPHIRCFYDNSEGVYAFAVCGLACFCRSECSNDPDWVEKKIKGMDCDRVAIKPHVRCAYKDSKGVSAAESCRIACSNCDPNENTEPTKSPTASSSRLECSNDPYWVYKGLDVPMDCDDVAIKPHFRCAYKDSKGVSAAQACRVACSDCDPIETTEPTKSPTTSPTDEPTATPLPLCNDHHKWKYTDTENEKKFNCGAVHKDTNLCEEEGKIGNKKQKVKGKFACRIACGNDKECAIPTCVDDADWTPKKVKAGLFENCASIDKMRSKEKKKKFCAFIGSDKKTFAYEACQQCKACTEP